MRAVRPSKRSILRAVVTLSLVASLITISPPAHAAGELDTTFDGDGKVITSFGGSFDHARAMVIQPDGKVVVAGLTEPGWPAAHFALARFNPDGSLDPAFDGDGKLTTSFLIHSVADGMALQDDGKILVTGYTTPSPGSANGDFALARYNSDGSLDASFDGDGKLMTDFAGGHDLPKAVSVQDDGRIVVAGQTGTFPDCNCSVNFALARYNTDGSLDATFDGDGKTTTDLGTSGDIAEAMTLQPDGKIIAAGHTSTAEFALARYNTDGSLDVSFDGDGMLTTDFAGGTFDQALAVALQSDGKIVAAGNSTQGGGGGNYALARYNPDGSLDGTFDGDGKVATDFTGDNEGATSLAIQSNGKIVAVGSTPAAGGRDFRIARYNSDGSVDATFDTDGNVVTDFGSNDTVDAVALQSDGKIVAAGGSPGGTNNFELARYLGDTTGVTCANAIATITGTEGDDVLFGTEWDDVIFGLGGNDEIHANEGNDVICGGPGADHIDGQAGDDLVDGGEGQDRAAFHSAPGPVTANLVTGIATGDGNDELVSIENLAGSDEFNDTLIGDAENNFIEGRGGGDTMDGGGGFDIVGFFDAPEPVTASLVTGTATGEGSDVLVGFEGLAGGFFGDTLVGDSGDNFFIPRGGDDAITGGSGPDTVLFEAGPVNVNLASGKATGEGSDSLAGIEGVIGTAFNDAIAGNAGPNRLFGRGGNDAISGKAGDDSLDGGDGTDALSGGPGVDSCINGEFLVGCEQGLQGNRIALLSGDQRYPAAEKSYVRHGWIFPLEDTAEETGWLNLSDEERAERLDDKVWRFELWIDGSQVSLDRSVHLTQDGVEKWHFVQFDKNEFAPGTYEFRGIWYGDSDDDDVSEIELDVTISVEFTG